MDKTTEKGHSGVQVHSRGPIFPCVIMRTETYPDAVSRVTNRPIVGWTLILPNGCRVDHPSWTSAYEHGITDANHYNQSRAKREVKVGTYHEDYTPTGVWANADLTSKMVRMMTDNVKIAKRLRKTSDGAILKMYDDLKQRELESQLERFKYEDETKIGFKDRPHSETGGER